MLAARGLPDPGPGIGAGCAAMTWLWLVRGPNAWLAPLAPCPPLVTGTPPLLARTATAPPPECVGDIGPSSTSLVLFIAGRGGAEQPQACGMMPKCRVAVPEHMHRLLPRNAQSS
jgi:hypothetical protein